MLVNIDTVQVAHVLYVDAPVQQAVAATASAGALCQDVPDAARAAACAQGELQSLQARRPAVRLPEHVQPAQHARGRRAGRGRGVARHWWDFPLKLVGWVVTAFAVSFGAPFWFEALSRLGSLRTTGTRPTPSTGHG